MNDTQNPVVAPVAAAPVSDQPVAPVADVNPTPAVVPGPDPISAPVPASNPVAAPVEEVIPVAPTETVPAPLPVDQVVTDVKVELPQVPSASTVVEAPVADTQTV